MKENLLDYIEPEISFEFNEDDSDVDGTHVLAKVKGQFFVPDGVSRNSRFYPKKLWERVIADPNIKNKIKERLMFGTVGHDAKLNDKAIREGLVSHVMTDIHINEKGLGIGEALILNTDAGRNLHTLLRAGSKLCVSSRANGTFKGKKNGMPVVDEDTYDVEGWDFVIRPGFLAAKPAIAEALDAIESLHNDLEEDNENETHNEENEMENKKLIEHITDENAELKNKVGGLTDEVATLKENHRVVTEENTHVKGELTKLEEANKTIDAYSEFGTAEEIKEKLETATTDAETLAAYEALGDSPEAVETALTKSRDYIVKVSEEFGTVDEIEEALTTAVEFKESIDEIGTVEEIKESLEVLETIAEGKVEEENKTAIATLVKDTSLSEEKIVELLKKYSATDIKDLYATVNESSNDDDSDSYKKKNFSEDDKDDNDDVNEDSFKSIVDMSRIERMNERLGK